MQGIVQSGDGNAARFVQSARDQLADEIGFDPYPGTLNLESDPSNSPLDEITETSDNCSGFELARCLVEGVRAALIRPLVSNYPKSKHELLAPVCLRDLFDLTDGDRLEITFSHPEDGSLPSRSVPPEHVDLFNALIVDLDGTVVDLDVDWEAVHKEIEDVLEPFLDRPLAACGEAEVFHTAAEEGYYDEIERMLVHYERQGVETASCLSPLSVLRSFSGPVGVCTANAVITAETVLERFNAVNRVDAIVGRDSMPHWKPEPEPLLRVSAELGVRPGNAVFIGDSRTDIQAARAAETSVLHRDQLAFSR